MATPIRRPTILITGGPGGGKSTLIAEVLRDAGLAGRFVVLPEAVHVALRSSISPEEPIFQRLIVSCQKAIEDAVGGALDPEDTRALLTHRGTLDPLAFCLARGWSEAEFWRVTGTRREDELARYRGVLHLVSTAIGMPERYRYRPEEHRPERPEEAARLDDLLTEIYRCHPRYSRIDNEGRDWPAKSQAARQALLALIIRANSP